MTDWMLAYADRRQAELKGEAALREQYQTNPFDAAAALNAGKAAVLRHLAGDA